MEEKNLKSSLDLSCISCGDVGEIPKSISKESNSEDEE